MKSQIKWLLAAAAIVFAAPAAMAGTVVAVTGPSASQYPVGKQIGDTQRISLQAGDRLTVLDTAGTRVFSGPGTFVLARAGRQSQNRAFSALTQQRQATRARTGATRDGVLNGPPQRPVLWYVDVESEGKVCLSDPTLVRLWRNNTDAEAAYTITAVANPATPVRIAFLEGEMLAGWDSRLALTEGLIYAIRPVSGAAPVEVNFVFLDDVPDDPEALAAKLIEHGCMKQLDILTSAMNEE